jgi:GAF domain-containing protein
MSHADRDKTLIEAFVFLADSLRTGYDVVDTMDILVQASTSYTSATEAGILLSGSDERLHIVASTSERSSDVEEAQIGADEGPCIDAFRTGVVVEVPDIAAERDRWPNFVDIAAEQNFQAAHATPLTLHGQALGGMNLFAPQKGQLSDRDAALVEGMAQMATISIVQFTLTQKQATVNDQLQRALDTRILIEQAKGVLAERHNIGFEAAFDMLRSHARSTSTKLHDVSQQIVLRRLSI